MCSRRITSNATVPAKTSAGRRNAVDGGERRRRVRDASSSVVGSFEACPIVRAFRRPENTCDQHRQDAGQKDPVEVSGPTDRSNRCPQPLHLIQVEKIGSYEGAERAADIGKRRRIPARQQQGDGRCRKWGDENRKRDAEARNRSG